MDWTKVDASLDCREYPEPRGFTRNIHRVSDVALYIVPVSDIGRAVIVAPFNLPDGLTEAQLARKFTDFVARHPAFQGIPVDVQKITELDSITHLGPDGHAGVYKYGGRGKDEFAIVIQSYDQVSSHQFRLHMFDEIKGHVHADLTQAEKDRRLAQRPGQKYVVGSQAYNVAMVRGAYNRAYILSEIFRAIGVENANAKVKIGGSTIVTATQSNYREYPCVFLEKEGKDMRIYNWAYRKQDILSGAPWHMLAHEGLNTFYGDPGVVEAVNDSNTIGVAMRLPLSGVIPRITDHVEKEVVDEVSSVVSWQSPISVMYAADPRKYRNTEKAFDEFQREYHLTLMRVCFWRTIAVALYPPLYSELTLEELAMYSKGENTLIPYKRYPELASAWTSLMNFHLHRDACLWHAKEMRKTHSSVPQYDMLPLADLVGNYSGDMTSNDVDTAALRSMMVNYSVICEMMDGVPNWDVVAPTAHLAHEEMLDRMVAESDEGTVSAKEEKFAYSESEGTTGMSDAEGIARLELGRQKLGQPDPTVKKNKKPVRTLPERSDYFANSTGVDSDADLFSDAYSELD